MNRIVHCTINLEKVLNDLYDMMNTYFDSTETVYADDEHEKYNSLYEDSRVIKACLALVQSMDLITKEEYEECEQKVDCEMHERLSHFYKNKED